MGEDGLERVLVRFHVDCGRNGELDGLFICTMGDYRSIQGETVDFGEVLGKHSQISVDIDASHLEIVSRDPEKVQWLEGLFNPGKAVADFMPTTTISGFSPFDFIEFRDVYHEDDDDAE